MGMTARLGALGGKEAEADLPGRIGLIRIHQHHRLPGAQCQSAIDDGHRERRRDERRQDMVGPMAGRSVNMAPPKIRREHVVDDVEQVGITSSSRLNESNPCRGMRAEDLHDPIALTGDESPNINREVNNLRARSRMYLEHLCVHLPRT